MVPPRVVSVLYSTNDKVTYHRRKRRRPCLHSSQWLRASLALR